MMDAWSEGIYDAYYIIKKIIVEEWFSILIYALLSTIILFLPLIGQKLNKFFNKKRR